MDSLLQWLSWLRRADTDHYCVFSCFKVKTIFLLCIDVTKRIIMLTQRHIYADWIVTYCLAVRVGQLRFMVQDLALDNQVEGAS